MRLDRLNDEGTIATVSGAWSFITDRFSGFLVGVQARPASSTTIYTLRIKNDDDFEIFIRKGIRGEIVQDMRTPVRGRLTVSIEGATADEEFTVCLFADSD